MTPFGSGAAVSPQAAPTSSDAPPLRGQCHGFRVHSDQALPLLRPATHPGAPLTVRSAPWAPREPDRAPLQQWAPTEHNPRPQRLHRLDDGYGIWIDGLGGYHVAPAVPRITVFGALAAVQWATRLWGVPAALCFGRQDISLHAAAVQVGQAALLITAPGRFGKTTLAAAFARSGHRVLTEDICRCEVHGPPRVHPGPAVLRLRPDAAAHVGAIPGARPVFTDHERVHLALARPGDAAPVPIRAVVALRRQDGPDELERLDPATALPLLWATSFHLPEPADRARCFLGVSALVEQVPVWRLGRQVDYARLPTLVDRLVATCLS